MLTKGPALLVLSSLLFSSPAWAETGLSLKECLSLASRNNPQLVVSREEIERANAGVEQARAAWLPALGMTGNLTRQGALATTGGGLELSYDLDFSGARGAQSALADLQLGMAREQAAQTAQQLRQDVVNAYYDLQHAFEQTRIAQLATSQAKALLEEATAMKSGGESTRFEVQRAELQLAQAQHEEIDARLNRRVLREALNRLIGFRDQDMFPSDPVREVGDWKGSFEDSLRLARENSPALKRYALQRAIAQERRRLALSSSGFKSAFFADADSRGSYQGSWLSGPGLGTGYTVGARVSMSLFDGGAARASAAQWEREAAITQAQEADAGHALTLEIERAYRTLASCREAIQYSNTARQKAKEVLQSARLRLRAGLGTQTDVIMAQSDLIQCEVARNGAILDYNRAHATLERHCLGAGF